MNCGEVALALDDRGGGIELFLGGRETVSWVRIPPTILPPQTFAVLLVQWSVSRASETLSAASSKGEQGRLLASFAMVTDDASYSVTIRGVYGLSVPEDAEPDACSSPHIAVDCSMSVMDDEGGPEAPSNSKEFVQDQNKIVGGTKFVVLMFSPQRRSVVRQGESNDVWTTVS
jgi:hypothetical protein